MDAAVPARAAVIDRETRWWYNKSIHGDRSFGAVVAYTTTAPIPPYGRSGAGALPQRYTDPSGRKEDRLIGGGNKKSAL